MNFYEPPVLEESERHLQQGDILHPVPFVGFSVTEVIILSPGAEEPDTVDLTENMNLPAETKLFANVEMSTGIVLNQSCDLSNRPRYGRPILVARVLPPGERNIKISPERSVKNNVDAIKDVANPGKRPSKFYLPEHESGDFNMPRSIADLLEVTSFPPSNFSALSSLIQLRLQRRGAGTRGATSAAKGLALTPTSRVRIHDSCESSEHFSKMRIARLDQLEVLSAEHD